MKRFLEGKKIFFYIVTAHQFPLDHWKSWVRKVGGEIVQSSEYATHIIVKVDLLAPGRPVLVTHRTLAREAGKRRNIYDFVTLWGNVFEQGQVVYPATKAIVHWRWLQECLMHEELIPIQEEWEIRGEYWRNSRPERPRDSLTDRTQRYVAPFPPPPLPILHPDDLAARVLAAPVPAVPAAPTTAAAAAAPSAPSAAAAPSAPDAVPAPDAPDAAVAPSPPLAPADPAAPSAPLAASAPSPLPLLPSAPTPYTLRTWTPGESAPTPPAGPSRTVLGKRRARSKDVALPEPEEPRPPPVALTPRAADSAGPSTRRGVVEPGSSGATKTKGPIDSWEAESTMEELAHLAILSSWEYPLGVFGTLVDANGATVWHRPPPSL